MIRVPTYDGRQIMTAPLPAVRQETPRGIEAGQRVTAAWTRAGGAVSAVGETMLKEARTEEARLRAETNESAVKETATRAQDALRDLLWNPETGYYTRQGRAAVEGLEGVKGTLHDLEESLLSTLDETQRKLFSPVFAGLRSQALDGAYKHASQQHKARLIDASTERVRSAERSVQTEGAAALPEALMTQAVEVRDQAETLNQPPQIMQQRVAAGSAQLVLQAFAHALEREQPDQAETLLGQYENLFTPDIVERGRAMVSERRTYAAVQGYGAALALDEAAAPPDDLSEEARSMAVEIAASLRNEQRREKERKNRITRDTAWAHFDEGGTLGTLPFAVLQGLPEEQRSVFKEMEQRRLGVRPDETNPAAYIKLACLSPNEWGKTEINSYRPDLSNSDFASLRARALDPATAQRSRSWRMVREMMEKIGLDPQTEEPWVAAPFRTLIPRFEDILDSMRDGGASSSDEVLKQKVGALLVSSFSSSLQEARRKRQEGESA